ncbi:3-dehydroquinate synthase [Simkania sp.]|uniref:3-dehydroquinate synthase n=1 Tax=Simkania sp. TaxID=34094 RepID=UPI003B52C2D9
MKDQITLKTKSKEFKTTISIGFDLLKNPHFLKVCQQQHSPLAIVTDHHVGKLYGQPLLDLLIESGLDATLHTFKAGEQSKSRSVKAQLEDELFESGHGRGSTLIAMGGGVTTDLVGYIAATFCRGVPYISIPTSLLGMVDASIGGKTGINVAYGKNLLGATYHPLAIFMDLSFLSTLSDAGMREGTAEILKHGLIEHSYLFEMLDEDLEKWTKRDMPFFKKLVYESCQVKRKVVEVDPYEKGMRRMLNFGHTIGHAIEVLEEYKMPHGEAVALGMIVESMISFKLGKLSESEFDEIYRLIKVMGYRLSISEKVTESQMLHMMRFDKKAKKRTPRFVILDGIGKVESFKDAYCTEIDEELLEETLGWMVAEFYKGDA